MKTTPLLLLSAFAIATTQGFAQERVVPKNLYNTWGNGLATYDLARDGKRTHQMWIRGDQLRNPTIFRELGERLDQQGSDAVQVRLTYKLDNSSVTWMTMDPDPTKNLSANAVTVFDAQVNLPSTAGASSPNEAVWVKITRPFVYRGPSLMIEKVWTPVSSSGRRRFDATSINPRSNLRGGITCGGALRASYDQTNSQHVISLSGAPANAVAVVLLGVENTVFAGAIPLPLKLDGAGFTGCVLGVDPLLTLAFQADAQGVGTLRLPYTEPTSGTEMWTIQVMHQDSTKPAGFATTNHVNSVYGKTGLVRNLRVDNRGTKGPDAFNGTGPIMMFR